MALDDNYIMSLRLFESIKISAHEPWRHKKVPHDSFKAKEMAEPDFLCMAFAPYSFLRPTC